MSSKTALEDLFLEQVREAGFPEPIREFPFALSIGRRWRFDFAWESHRVAVEIDGGLYSPVRMGHSRGHQIEEDYVKLANAAIMGWIVIRIGDHMLKTPRNPKYRLESGIALTTKALFLRGWEM